jgi:hypothetical protein
MHDFTLCNSLVNVSGRWKRAVGREAELAMLLFLETTLQLDAGCAHLVKHVKLHQRADKQSKTQSHVMSVSWYVCICLKACIGKTGISLLLLFLTLNRMYNSIQRIVLNCKLQKIDARLWPVLKIFFGRASQLAFATFPLPRLLCSLRT